MLVIGLTGSIGMGRSTAAGMLRTLGVPVHDSDAAVHRLIRKGGRAVARIAEAFPGVVKDGAVDRAALGARVFGDPAALNDWIRRHPSTGAHPSCTARMGPDGDPLAVCDERGFVRGVRGLRIADAALMPVVPSANTNIPTIMIGERVGEWVREDLAN